ncbi:hypothetical protein HanIR_Chr08g0342711 [Helianthus annuus]|nr:hypothetical protein HanIR_Chr08g0342711 [Helianthus annuus]
MIYIIRERRLEAGVGHLKPLWSPKWAFFFFFFSVFSDLLALIEVLTIYCPNNLVGITQITQVFQDTDIG